MAGEKKGFFKKLFAGLDKTRKNIVNNIESVFLGYDVVDDDFYEELEEVLIMGDLGVNTAEDVIEELQKRAKENHVKKPSDCKELLMDILKEEMAVPSDAYDFEEGQSIVLVIGVNGVGKTTSIGKLASQYKNCGKKVLLAAADTFRAAAIDQLEEWSRRSDVPMIKQAEGSDPSAVVFDAVNAAKARNIDILICDTAGRLHNKKNLMDELRKMDRIITKGFPEAKRENLLVLDATTGQNAIMQAKEFLDVSEINGIILTKMDGTAKGGMAIAIQKELGIPVKYIGVGEQIDDLQRFNADDFVSALFDQEGEE